MLRYELEVNVAAGQYSRCNVINRLVLKTILRTKFILFFMIRQRRCSRFHFAFNTIDENETTTTTIKQLIQLINKMFILWISEILFL